MHAICLMMPAVQLIDILSHSDTWDRVQYRQNSLVSPLFSLITRQTSFCVVAPSCNTGVTLLDLPTWPPTPPLGNTPCVCRFNAVSKHWCFQCESAFGHLLLFFSGLFPACSFSLFSSSVFRSLPGHAHTRTSKVRRPKTRPLEEEEEEEVGEMEQGEKVYVGWAAVWSCSSSSSRTHSAVSRVRMVRMGRRFIPPMHELLHMKRKRIVLISEPSCNTQGTGSLWHFIAERCFLFVL